MEELHDDSHERRAEQQPNLSPRSPLECDGVEFVGTWPPVQEFDAANDKLAVSAPQFVESSYTRVLAESCSSIVDEIAEVDRAEARRQAWKVELIDEARRASETTLHGVRMLGSMLSPAKQQEMARRSLVAELACALRMPEATVIGMITEAEALMHRLPATMEALRAGDISYRHARVMVDQTTTLRNDAALALEEQALPHARTLTVTKFRAKTRCQCGILAMRALLPS